MHAGQVQSTAASVGSTMRSLPDGASPVVVATVGKQVLGNDELDNATIEPDVSKDCTFSASMLAALLPSAMVCPAPVDTAK